MGDTGGERALFPRFSREDGEKPRKIEQILADSQIEAISRVIADQIGADGAEAAAIIWAMLSARGAVARDVFAKFGRRDGSIQTYGPISTA